jgi:hypothetical protein
VKDLLAPALVVTLTALLLAPGVIVAGMLHRREQLQVRYIVPVAALVACLVGYATVGVYLLNPALGRVASAVVLLGEIAAVVALAAVPAWRRLLRALDVWFPPALLAAVALFYLGASRACQIDGFSCLTYGYPPDNVLPLWFADNVAAGAPLTLMGDWHGSDRPPLQSGVVLAHALLTLDGPIRELAYQVLGCLLQCLWVVAVWVAGRRLALSPARIAAVLALCVTSGFFYLNSFYVWPKLLAGALAMVGVLLLFAEPASRVTWALAAAFLAAALLAHTGVVFPLIPLAVLLFARRRYRPPLRVLPVAALVGLALLGPWLLYQNLIDPPGNRLVKWHLAGVIEIDERSFGQALWDQYSQTPVATLLANRIESLRIVLAGPPWERPNPLTDGFFADFPGATTLLRAVEFRSTLLALGLVAIGGLLLLWPRARARVREAGVDVTLLRLLLGGAALGLLVWILMMFDGGSTVIHQGSYLTMIMLFVGLATVVVTQPRLVVATVLSLQAGYFLWVWLIDPLTLGPVKPVWLVWATTGLAGVGAALAIVGRQRGVADPQSAPAAPAEAVLSADG